MTIHSITGRTLADPGIVPEVGDDQVAFDLYADGTIGHAGEGTASADAEPDRRKRLAQAIRFVRSQGKHGATCGEYERAYDIGHGVASAPLSMAHKDGHLARLAERRGRGEVYVAPEFVDGRETRAHKSNRRQVPDTDVYQRLADQGVLRVRLEMALRSHDNWGALASAALYLTTLETVLAHWPKDDVR